MWSSVKAWIWKHDASMLCIAGVFAIIAITIVLFLIYKSFCKNPVCDGSSHNNTLAMTRLGMSQVMIEYSVEELAEATENFSEDNFIGYASLGQTYIGILQDTLVVIKTLARPLRPRFLAEVINLSNIRHCNVVKLLGYCCENDRQMLVYEHVLFGNMRDRLRGSIIHFTFKQRMWIAIGAARGLLHLHSLTPPLAHNRFSTASVLLDYHLEAKVSDVGLSRLLETRHEEANDDHDLEVGFYNQGRFDWTSDVYSFGLFLVELISGEEPGTLSPHEDMFRLLNPRIETYTFADERMNGSFTRVALDSVTEIMMRCLAFPAMRRPKMEKIVTDLEGIDLNINLIPTGE